MGATTSDKLGATEMPSVTVTEAQRVDVARGQVFNTTELLELILTGLDPIDLIRTQRVGRKWQAVIEGSDVLQRKLFYKANANEQAIRYVYKRDGSGNWVVDSDRNTKVKDMTLNPFFDRIFKRVPCRYWGLHEYEVSNTSNVGSWRSMLLTAPPAVSITVRPVRRSILDSGATEIWMQDGVGIRMGDIVDAAQGYKLRRGQTQLAFGDDMPAPNLLRM